MKISVKNINSLDNALQVIIQYMQSYDTYLRSADRVEANFRNTNDPCY